GTAGGTALTDLQPCQVSLGHSTTLTAVSADAAADGTGGYATHDALLLSNSFPGGTGPVLDQRVTTGYRYDPTSATACDNPNQDYRSFNLQCAGYAVEIGGSPAPSSSYTPQYDPVIPDVRTSVCDAGGTHCTTPAVPATGACVYTGPTRVYLNPDGTATITSPQTTAPAAGSPPGCYPAALAGGIWQYRTPVLASLAGFTGVFAVRNDGSPPGSPADAHSPTGWNLTGQKATSTPSGADTVFYRSVDAATAPDAPTAQAGGFTAPGDNPQTWSMYSSTKKCGAVSRQTDTPNGPKPWDEQTFQCDWFGKMGDNTFLPPTAPDDAYTQFQNQLNADLARTSPMTVPGNDGNTVDVTVDGTRTSGQDIDCTTQTFAPATATGQQLVCLIQHDLRTANTGLNEANWPSPARSGYTHQYVVSAYDQSSSSRTVSVGSAPASGVTDPLFAGTATGSASTETVTTTTTTYSVASQVYGCYVYGLVGGLLGTPAGTMDVDGSSCTNLIPTGKWAWGNGYYPDRTSPQFQFTVVRKTYSDFTQGASATAYFPSMKDVTQYAVGTGPASGPGDLYVEGTATTTLALVAQNDVVVTGSLRPDSPAEAVELVAQGNARLYHPVTCTATDPGAIDATTAGFCPNDITGMYSGVPDPPDRPDRQYANLRTDLDDVTVNAAIFALGGAPSTAGCPQWSGDGVCGGQFGVDNYDRGAGLGTLTVQGTLVMQHHGPVGREWEISDEAGQSSRPHSGYQLDLRYQNLRAPLAADDAVAGVISPVTTTSSAWHVVSISTGGPS
ncbi:MAG TPA: hypothetical protein VHC23_15125, partial [Jatrophihabitans sp.]|nr:hypothetical protein [Jatrophihabitans sp.]